MTNKTDTELLEVISDHQDYQDAAVIAALEELRSRQKLEAHQLKLLTKLKRIKMQVTSKRLIRKKCSLLRNLCRLHG